MKKIVTRTICEPYIIAFERSYKDSDGVTHQEVRYYSTTSKNAALLRQALTNRLRQIQERHDAWDKYLDSVR